jgi:starvation-inducible DNA-binding protein
VYRLKFLKFVTDNVLISHNENHTYMKANLGIAEKESQQVALEMNKVLADEFVIYTKTRNYHWNVEGSNFMEMHKLYQTQYEQLDDIIDDVAERIRTIGHYTEARLKDYVQLTHLSEPDYTTEQNAQLKNLLQDHEAIIKNLRYLITLFAETNKDLGTSDFVTGLMKEHEKMAWFLRAYLK